MAQEKLAAITVREPAANEAAGNADLVSKPVAAPRQRTLTIGIWTGVAAVVFTAAVIAWAIALTVKYAEVTNPASANNGLSNSALKMDVAVVGGGISGLYSAWRIDNETALDVQVFEATNRIGGRTYTRVANDACPDAAPLEVGGMRLRVGVDFISLRIAEMLGVRMYPVNMNGWNGTGGVGLTQDDPRNIVQLRGTTMTNAQFEALTVGSARAAGLKYDLQLLNGSVCNDATPLVDCINAPGNAITAAVQPISEADMCAGPTKTLANTFLKLLGPTPQLSSPVIAWSLAALGQALGLPRDMAVLGDEAGGYDEGASLDGAAWPNEAAMATAQGGSIQRYVRPQFGLMQMSTVLADAFRASRAAKGRAAIHTNRRLVKLERAPAGSGYKYALTFLVTKTSPCGGVHRSVNTATKQVVFANRVILGLTRQALEELRQADDDVLFGRDMSAIDEVLQGVFTGDALKLYAMWKGEEAARAGPAWFNKAVNPGSWNTTAGRHITSGWPAQILSWYPGTAMLTPTPGSDGSCKNMTVLQVYVSGPERTAIFETMTSNVASLSPQCVATAGVPAEQADAVCGACVTQPYGPPSEGVSDAMKKGFMAMLSRFLGRNESDIVPPTSITYVLWSGNDRNSAYHAWRGGARWWDLSQKALQPNAAEAVHIVGEAFAPPHGQGWIEGSLQTAERMLVLKMGLPRLSGLTRNDICRFNPFVTEQPSA